jgi:hypothetical protein
MLVVMHGLVPSEIEFEETHYVNVDLEIGSSRKLDVLAAELDKKLFSLYRGRYGGLYRAHYETTSMRASRTPTGTILALVRVLKRLSPAAQRAWRAARVRDFNIGFQASFEPRHFEAAIDPGAIKQVAALGGRIVITVYAPDIPQPQPAGKRRLARGTMKESS